MRRLGKRQEVELPRNEEKLPARQLEEAFGLLRADLPLREVANRFGINHESLRQLAQRNGVEVRPRGQKLSPTLRVLTAEQRQEAIDLLRSGVPLRQVAKQFGINRYSLRRLVKRDED